MSEARKNRARRRAAMLAATAAVVAGGGTMTAASAGADRAAAAAPAIVPKPVAMSTGTGSFVLDGHTHVVATSRTARSVAAGLADALGRVVGHRLPVAAAAGHGGAIRFVQRDPGTLGADRLHEGYQLDVTPREVTVEAPTAAGLFHGAQTLRQLVPWSGAGRAAIPAVHVTDYPRYAYRGFMFDIARHFEPPAAVEKLIDVAAQYKLNTLHLHLADDQGFRVQIDGFPRLTSIGAQGSVGTGGRTMDPGGYWTQAQYEQVVAYAAARFVSVVPEVDSPSHNNAIEMSEYGDVANPLLDGHPQDIACGYQNPPTWNYSMDVGYSGMCPDSSNTWAIYTAIIDQLARLSSSPYYHLGGDEAHPFTSAQYAAFMNRETPIVQAAGKIPMGWADGYATVPGSNPPPGSVAESWLPGASDGAAAVQKGMRVVMAPADHAYIDQSYPNDTSGLGLGWACRGCDLDVNYDWDPGSFPGVPDSSVLGVEGALFGETIPTLADAEWLMLPRLMAIAELGWSPKEARTGVTSPAFVDFAKRVAAQGPRLQAQGLNFFPTTQVPWQLQVAATGGAGRVLAAVSAPGTPTGQLTATVDWGDGTVTTVPVRGTDPRPGRVNGLYAVTAEHRSGHSGHRAHRTVTVTVRAADGRTATATV